MTDYRLYDCSPIEFQNIVSDICQEILGFGLISFSEGRDGGRDGKFEGISSKFPSESEKWSGKFIIQAKRKASPIASCSDTDFRNELLNKEVPKVKKLISKKECDIYIVFTSRSYAGDGGEKLLGDLKKALDLDKVLILGKETITRYLNSSPEIVKRNNLAKYQDPIRFNSGDIKEIILAFHTSKNNLAENITQEEFSQNFISKEEKNRINKLSKSYFDSIQKESLPYFKGIEEFLENPRNENFLELYREITNELKFKIITKREEYGLFDEIFSMMFDFVLENHPEIKNKRRLIHTLLHYMYWHCDIGEDA